jgi:hypothetical protein
VKQHGGDDDEHDVLEGLLDEALVRGAELDPHDHQQGAVIEQAHRHSVAAHPPSHWLHQVPYRLKHKASSKPDELTPNNHHVPASMPVYFICRWWAQQGISDAEFTAAKDDTLKESSTTKNCSV